MELIGLMIGAVIAAVGGALIAGIIMIFPKLRRFALAAGVLPGAALAMVFVTSSIVYDHSAVCGPDAEWDRCPSLIAKVVLWSCSLIGTATIVAVSYWVQRECATGWENFRRRKESISLRK